MSSENVKRRQEMEKRIARKLLEAGHEAGYSFNVNNGGDEDELPKPVRTIETVLEAMFATDDEKIHFYKGEKYVGWVWFIYGNGNGGLDVISDYTTNLDPIMGPVNALIDQYN